MDILKYISLKDIIYFIIIIALAYRVYLLEQNHPQIEGMSTDEAISNIASVYNKGKLVVNELEVKGNTTISGNTTIGGNATVNGSTTLKKNTTISGSATISGNATVNGSTTLNKGSNCCLKY